MSEQAVKSAKNRGFQKLQGKQRQRGSKAKDNFFSAQLDEGREDSKQVNREGNQND
jgi:hypothetical protein